MTNTATKIKAVFTHATTPEEIPRWFLRLMLIMILLTPVPGWAMLWQLWWDEENDIGSIFRWAWTGGSMV